jgi:hypothetical protein
MEIRAIKEQLSIEKVLSLYGLEVKNKMACCPFHNDKTPSMQVFSDSNTVRCYSGNCDKSGKVIDVIDFIMYREGCSKHEAIKKAGSLLGGTGIALAATPVPLEKAPYKAYREIEGEILDELFAGMAYNLRLGKRALAYLQERALDKDRLEIGYNSRTYKGLNSCIVFPLRDKAGHVASLYGRNVLDSPNKHYYLKNRRGLYPGYPGSETTKLILFESVIDCASMWQHRELLGDGYALLACFGTNGFMAEHQMAIASLETLEEIIFCFDNDDAGIAAVKKYTGELSGSYPHITISNIEVPGKDLNEALQGHDREILPALLLERKSLFVSTEKKERVNVPVNISTATGPEGMDTAINTSTGTDINITAELSSGTDTTSTAMEKPKPDRSVKSRLYNLQSINQYIGRSGIVGEENTRLLLFIIASSYRTGSPLHAIVQGSSGSGKTHLIGKVADLMPPEDVLRFTRITENSLYNWGEYDLVGKLMVIEDLDGLKEEALYALRELISNQRLSSSVSIKDKKGNIRSARKEVRGRFSSLSATTKGDTYEDNISRSFILAVDESPGQSRKIINYQNKRYAGEICREEEAKARKQLQEYIRGLQDYPVRNPYATRLELPEEVHKIRRLNEMYQSIIRQVTYLNQRQRKLKDGFLLTEIEDLRLATGILFDSIILKIDELDGSLRQFYERLKKYVGRKDKEFYLRDMRQKLNISKTQMFRYIQTLKDLDYIRPSGGYNNTGYKYKILYWDDYHKLREDVKKKLESQIEQLSVNRYNV